MTGQARYGRMMTSSEPDVLVIGAGVSGLTTAICLAEAGARVTVTPRRRRRGPRQPWPGRSGARIWSGRRPGRPLGRQHSGPAARPGRRPAAGVRTVSGLQASRAQASPPDWAAALDGFRLATGGELPPGFVAGWRFAAPVAAMPVYLRLPAGEVVTPAATRDYGPHVRLAGRGGREHRAGVIVNCSGIGARELVRRLKTDAGARPGGGGRQSRPHRVLRRRGR